MIEVQYPDKDGITGTVHRIVIKKIERFEKDGTFLVHGTENGFNVVLHLDIDPYGKIYKIPHTGLEYLKLSMPVYKKVNVTKSLLSQLDGKIVTSIKEDKKSDEVIKMFYHPQLHKMYISKDTANKLGYLDNKELHNFDDRPIIMNNNDLVSRFYELTDIKFDLIKDKYKVEVVNFNIAEQKEPDVPYNDLGNTYIDSEIKKLLMDLKYYLQQQGKVDPPTRDLVIKLIQRERTIKELPKGEFREEISQILYYDLKDLVATAQGFNLSDERAKNYNMKVESINKLLALKENGIDLSNVKELFKDIKENLNETFNYDNTIDARTWFLIENYINSLIETLLINDEFKFRLEISKFNKNGVLYGQIMFELRNKLEGKNTK